MAENSISSSSWLGPDKGLFSARDPSAKEREGDKEIEKSICIDKGIKRKINS